MALEVYLQRGLGKRNVDRPLGEITMSIPTREHLLQRKLRQADKQYDSSGRCQSASVLGHPSGLVNGLALVAQMEAVRGPNIELDPLSKAILAAALPVSSVSQVANAGDARDAGSILGLGRCPGEGHGNPLQYFYLENPMNRGAWRATAHGVPKKSDTTEHTFRVILSN